MKKIHVFTSAACNYLPKVRTLVRSIRTHQPDWVVHLALSDDIPEGMDLRDEPFDEIHPASSLGIPAFCGWSFCHGIVELSTAIKPYLLARLLEREDCGGVIYLDPDTVLFSPLHEVVDILSSASIALTPHQVTPEVDVGAVMDNEIASLKHGIYNLGFIAIAPTDTGKRFAAWWASRMYHFCRNEIHNGLFTDQRWIDLVPAFFEDVCLLRSPRLNVAPWNITTRRLDGEAPNALTVDGMPLGFYHFTGFDNGAHHAMSMKNAADQPAVHKVIEWYAGQIAGAKNDPLASVGWAYATFSDGQPIPPAARVVYRERPDLQRAFPDPYLAPGYKVWWETQGAIEYPALFDPSSSPQALRALTATLTPGFGGGNVPAAGPLRAHLRRVASRPGHGATLVKRAWEVLRTEGMPGLIKRLSH